MSWFQKTVSAFADTFIAVFVVVVLFVFFFNSKTVMADLSFCRLPFVLFLHGAWIPVEPYNQC